MLASAPTLVDLAEAWSSPTRSTRRRSGATARRSPRPTSSTRGTTSPTAQNIYDPTGYNDIASVDDCDPQTAVVTFSKPYAGWQGLFGGGYGIFPSHLLKGKNQDALMKDGYTWSGGPYEMPVVAEGLVDHPGPEPEVVRHRQVAPRQGRLPAGDRHRRPSSRRSSRGQVKMIYPQPQIDVVNQIGSGIPGANSNYNADTGAFEVIWMNMGAAAAERPQGAPGHRLLDRPQRHRQGAVRQARA